MNDQEILAMLEQRASVAGVRLTDALGERVVTYFQLLRAWNTRMNLTGFDLAHPSDAAIDRLCIEPLLAASAIESRPVTRMLDIGSGGGSPAFPLALALGVEQLELVEIRHRKAVFLKEAARVLGLAERTTVWVDRFERLAGRPEFAARFDVVSVRAVKLGPEELALIHSCLRAEGNLVLFPGREGVLSSSLFTLETHLSPASGHGEVTVLKKSAK